MTHPTEIRRVRIWPRLLDAALAAADRGWHVFPLQPGTKQPAGHREDRCPRTGRCSEGHLKPEQRATTDPDLIRACWAQAPYGIGIATGPSGLVVIDLDVPKTNTKDAPDGATTFRALCERAAHSTPTTFTVRTGSGGWHLYFRAPNTGQLRNSAGKLGAGIDTRAWGGYVVAPGTTVSGRPYTALHPHTAVAPLPAWLHTKLAPPPRPVPRLCTATTAAAAAISAPAYVRAALRNETSAVATAPEGSRNRVLVRAARALGRFIASGDLARDVVEEALNEAGQTAGLTARECHAALTSALNWSIAHNPGRAA
ncbi:bifunctional DNA primase/polymerase [Streptomyces sp. NRRL S-1868]|uniref:bifunctional DNA primase/polymerase n=1 Tax=Streptomyces sp. NRRL S-1868 TaxID=1463892 RepID=UPI00068B4598|nr:bifunctional DNA primase/polymerase [Streptomyces sp. NRRL S-1868]